MEAQANLVLTQGFELLPKDKLLRRHDFPRGFIFGTASSAYQYEGEWKLRGKNIWDTFTHDHPEKIADQSNGDVAVDFYHRYENDVKLMKRLGGDAFRFSISWSRILPCGKLSKGVNEKGIKFYSDLIDDLKANGLEPFVTLFHWDVPQALQNEYGGFLSPRIVDDFRDFAELCFERFGDRVKNWITLNEPWSFSYGGYAAGTLAPGRCTPSLSKNERNFFAPYQCATFPPSRTPEQGDSGTEPYLVTHYQLLAHAAAVKLYREKYQACQKGKIGITLVSNWFESLTETVKDRAAAIRSLDFMFGWFMDPLTNGYYPHTMQTLVGNRLPKFSKEESDMVKGSFDFLGLNYYTARYAQDALTVHFPKPSYITDPHVKLLTERDGKPIGPQAGSDWLYVYPQGIKDLLLYTKNRYYDPLIYITENGVDEKKDGTSTMDYKRIDYHSDHLSFVRNAIREGVKVKGYFAWSLLDNFEWCEGYTVRFGIYYVDYENGLRRYPKLSSLWFQNLLKK